MTQTPLDWSEEILQEIFRNTSFGFVLIDLHGTIIEINEAFATMLERERSRILGRKMSEFVLEDDRDLTDTLLSRLCDSEIGNYDIQRRFALRGGNVLTTKVTASIIRSKDDEPICAVELIEDIGARLSAEHALRESELRYRKVVEDQMDFIVRWLPNGTRIFVNDAYCRYFDAPREKILGTSFFPLIAKEDRAAVRQRIAALTPENPVSTDQHRVLLPSGDVGWQEWTDRAIFDESGRIVELQSVGRDVTEQKAAEEALVRSEERFRRLFQDLPIAVWEVDWSEIVAHAEAAGFRSREEVLALGDDLVSEFGHFLGLSRILGVNPVALDLAGVSSHAEFVTWNRLAYPPESIETVVRAASSMVFGEAQETEIEIPMIRANGERIEVLLRWAKSGTEEEPWRFIVTVQDQTERKKAERALTESESRFRRFFRDLSIAAWLSDWSGVVEELEARGIDSPEALRAAFSERPDEFRVVGSRTVIRAVNPVALRLVGAETQEEFESWLPRYDAVAARRIVEASIPLLFRLADTATCEVPIRTLDGEAREVLLQWARTGSEREPWTFVVTALDLTERKKAERALWQSEAKYRSLFDELPIAVWVSDYSETVPILEQIGITSTAQVIEFANNNPKPERGSVRVREMNSVARGFFGVRDCGEFEVVMAKAITEESWRRLARATAPLIFDGQNETSVELTLERDDGTTYDILTRWGRTEPQDESWTFIVSAIDVTERNAAERALRASEAKYRRLFDELPIAVWVADWAEVIDEISEMGIRTKEDLIELAHQKGKPELVRISQASTVVEMNSVGLELFEIPERSEFRGRLGEMLTPESWRRLVRAAAPLIFENRHVVSVELTLERDDGTSFDLLTRWSRTEPRESSKRFIVSAIDVTERNQIEKDLEAQRRLLEQAEAIALLGSWEWDARSDEIRGSAEYSRILGRPEVERWTLDDFMDRVHREDLPRVMTLLSSGPGRGIGEPFDFRIVTPSGEVKHVRSQGYLARDEVGNLTGGFGMLQDVTAQKEAERVADQQREELVRADKMISLGILVSGVAHEINNPNHFIMLNAPFLRDVWRDALPALETWATDHSPFELAGLDWEEIRTEVPEILDEIQQGTERIRAIVAELKNFARDPGRGMSPNISINDVVRSAARLIAKRVKYSTSNFEITYADDLPSVHANMQKLEQVVINLVLNACDALGSSESAIRVVTGMDEGRNHVFVRVEDEGAGIPAEDLKRILDPFFTTKRTEGGTGLGLAVSHRIVKEHGGELRFDSEVGVGTTAIMKIPVDNDENGETN